ncbi:unnamed protein product [Symbiodinium natans]|uniref:Uncharacterized protein n=1 Tax=Symbiodinium natans TaxID=878477 RepID=A0A812NY42_9DINO|nr:unnamed protein product [Symbiodinium natans]
MLQVLPDLPVQTQCRVWGEHLWVCNTEYCCIFIEPVRAVWPILPGQGFCLALAEVLQAFPGELATVLKLVDQTSELQSGLKATEQKERLLGRLLVYAAVLQAGSLRHKPAAQGGNGHEALASEVVSKLGRGLLQVYNARPYMAPVAASILADTCGELCQGGHYAQVPEVISEWKLDQKVGEGEGMASLDGNVCGLVIGLRTAYEDAIRAGMTPSSLKSWPSCVRKDVLQGDVLPKVAKNLGKALAALPVGDPVPPLLAAFCAWWVRPYKGRDPVALQERIWPALEEGLFPDHRSPAALAQGFRGMAELATQLRSAGEDAKVDEVLAGFFQQFETGWSLLLGTVAWNKAPAYQSAVHAHSRLVAIVGGHRDVGQPAHPKAHQKKGQKQKPDDGAQRQDLDELPPFSISDETRLTILEALQSRKEFQKVPGNLQRQWQQALLAPLSPPGVRSRCSSLIASIAKGKGPTTRVAVVQLEHLAVHSKAPDEVILAVVFLLFTTAYFGSSTGSGAFSLRSFKEAVGLPTMPPEVDDVEVPVVKIVEEEREDWRTKVWSALAQLSRHTLPEAAERLVSGQEGPGSLASSPDFFAESTGVSNVGGWRDGVRRPRRFSGTAFHEGAKSCAERTWDGLFADEAKSPPDEDEQPHVAALMNLRTLEGDWVLNKGKSELLDPLLLVMDISWHPALPTRCDPPEYTEYRISVTRHFFTPVHMGHPLYSVIPLDGSVVKVPSPAGGTAQVRCLTRSPKQVVVLWARPSHVGGNCMQDTWILLDSDRATRRLEYRGTCITLEYVRKR